MYCPHTADGLPIFQFRKSYISFSARVVSVSFTRPPVSLNLSFACWIVLLTMCLTAFVSPFAHSAERPGLPATSWSVLWNFASATGAHSSDESARSEEHTSELQSPMY